MPTVAEQQAEAEQVIAAMFERYGVVLAVLVLAPLRHEEDED